MPIPRSARPTRLLRILLVSEGVCNYRCPFCCFWNGEGTQAPHACLDPADYRFLAGCIVGSGCDRIMLTGGEPLMFPRRRLLETVEAIASVPGLRDFWLTTNGSLLRPVLAGELAAAGLGRIVVSIAAADEVGYASYAGSHHGRLETVLGHIAQAVRRGLRVRVDVPLSAPGMASYGQLLTLLDRAAAAGVREAAYFRLHRTDENASTFDQLYVGADEITRAFTDDPRWRLLTRGNGQRVFSDGTLEVIVPAGTGVQTPRCRDNRCGLSCQGNYAAYLVSEPGRTFVRACHGSFADRRNEFELPQEALRQRDAAAVSAILAQAWAYAYGHEAAALGGGPVPDQAPARGGASSSRYRPV